MVTHTHTHTLEAITIVPAGIEKILNWTYPVTVGERKRINTLHLLHLKKKLDKKINDSWVKVTGD